MKQIAKVLIENFQSHARSELTFGRGLNVIIGPSDNGKSAILRAIRWALYNEPRGSEFVRSGARECRVTVTMSDGAEVVRELTLTKSGAPSRNRYLVKAAGADEFQVFEGFGTEVPLEVIRAHGMPQVLLDTDKRVVLSFGSQLEGPFLMAESGSLRARAIGRLLGVHVVDAAMRNTQRDQRTVKQETARLEQRLEQYDKDLAQYADIPEQEARLERAEALLTQAEALRARLARLEQVQEGLDRANREEIMLGARLAGLGDLPEAEAQVKRAEEAHRQEARLERLQQDLTRVETEGRFYKARVDALTALPIAEQRAREAAERQTRLTVLSRVEGDLRQRESELTRVGRELDRLGDVPKAASRVTEALAQLQRLEQLEKQLAQVQEVQQRLNTGKEYLTKTEAELRGHLSEYEGVLRHLGKCPTCMQPVAPASIKQIIAELGGGPTSGHSH
ncbi:MAG TPA: AAA family ATPase [Symbiobacteriaceae bacterium]|nr:AAA family ATPase [Symbiobacteriaceae bacterium]